MKNLVTFCLTLVCLQSAFSQTNDSATFYFQKGLQDKSNRLWMIAMSDFQKSLDFQPVNLNAQYALGSLEVELRKYDQAKVIFKKIYDSNANDSLAVENLAMMSFWNREWQECIVYANRARDLHVGKGWNYMIGKSYYEQEDYGHACKYLQAASREDSSNAEIPYLMARSYVEMNNYKTAIPFFQRAIGMDSSKYQWMYECALTMSTIYDDKSAIRYYELAAGKGYKKDNDFYENLSDSYVSAGQPEKGLELMLQVLERKPSDQDLLYSIANTCYRMKRYDDAINYWDRILSYDKANAKALYMIGMSYQKKGEEKKGQQLCDKAIEMDPSLKNLRQQRKLDM